MPRHSPSPPRHPPFAPTLLLSYGDRVTTTAEKPSWAAEAAGATADLGVLVPISVALIVLNGLSATAVMLPAAFLYLVVARIYALPIAVQPLKAFGAIAIAAGADADVIAAGALMMGVMFTLAGVTGTVDAIARWIPVPVVRGVQLTVAILLAKVAWNLVVNTPSNFSNQLPTSWSAVITVILLVLLWFLRGKLSLLTVGAAIVAMGVAVAVEGNVAFGPSAVTLPSLTAADFAAAATLLVLPQVPLTFANSCLAPADAARTYFGDAARRVTPGRLAASLGVANIVAAGMSGMPVCHGAGGLSAHVAFGARTWRAPAFMGVALLVAALGFGALLATALPAFPIAVLAALLGVAAITHALLLRDMRAPTDWLVVLVVAALGITANLAYGVLAGLVIARLARRGSSAALPHTDA